MADSPIDQYERGGAKVAEAIRGLTGDELRSFPVPGMWSIQQVVLHLMDADLVMADRMKRIIAEDRPPLLAFDESRWAGALHYHEQAVEDAVTVFDLNRRQMARVLRRLAPDMFQRTGRHSERGPVTLAELVQGAIDHLDHHLKFVYQKREKLGKRA